MKKKTMYMDRITRAFRENPSVLSTNQIYDILHAQITHNGRNYSRTPSKMNLTQLLSTNPEFIKVGHIDKVTNGFRERVITWELEE
tara:strand:- start:1145 stop:1402 length:258 start_codon:yes stop_codon:yes gene_type:complete